MQIIDDSAFYVHPQLFACLLHNCHTTLEGWRGEVEDVPEEVIIGGAEMLTHR